MKKEIENLAAKAILEIKKENDFIKTLDKEEFLKYLPKHRELHGSSNIAIFADNLYKPHLTAKDKRMVLYMLNKKVFNKYIFDKRRPKEQYKISCENGEVFSFIVKHTGKGCVSSQFFILK